TKNKTKNMKENLNNNQKLIKKTVDYFRSKDGEFFLNKRKAILFMVALIYVLSPIDIIPDFILGFGQGDDVIMALLSIFGIFLPRSK
ncbi:MAG: YkvA family protein, partial [Bacteroidales bacterium]